MGRLLASDYAIYVLSSSGGGPLGFVKVGRKCLYVTVSACLECVMSVCVCMCVHGQTTAVAPP